jgi:hypothetical protein
MHSESLYLKIGGRSFIVFVGLKVIISFVLNFFNLSVSGRFCGGTSRLFWLRVFLWFGLLLGILIVGLKPSTKGVTHSPSLFLLCIEEKLFNHVLHFIELVGVHAFHHIYALSYHIGAHVGHS